MKKVILLILFILIIALSLSLKLNRNTTAEVNNVIEQQEQNCINLAENAAQIRECVYTANDKWNKQITLYLNLLKENMTDEEYKLIKDSQDLWLQQSKKDNEIITKLIFNHGGTMYYDTAAINSLEINKNRALFLKEIYDCLKD